MSFETPPPASFEQEGNERKSIRERIVFPHVQPILEALEKQFEGTDKKLDSEVVKDILYEFIEQRINRAGVYESSEQGASFPWGVTDTAELAKKLYSRYSGEVLPEKLEPNPEKRKKEFEKFFAVVGESVGIRVLLIYFITVSKNTGIIMVRGDRFFCLIGFYLIHS